MPKFIGYRMKSGSLGNAGALIVRGESETEAKFVAAGFGPGGLVHSVMGNDGTFEASDLQAAWKKAEAELRTVTDN